MASIGLTITINERGDTVNFNSILIGSEDPKRLTDYYSRIFGEPKFSDGGYTGWQVGTGWVTIGPHDQVSGKNSQPGRLIWNIEAADVRSEFDRMVAAGATVVREPYGADESGEGLIATLSDPDDNYFQLMSPMGPM
jgi:predicted enzyme related to lactoylglutathione lyase